MAPRDPDGKFTRSTPQQKLAAHVERVNAAHPEKTPTPSMDDWRDAQQAPIGQEDWRAVNAANASQYAKLDESLDDFSRSFGLDKPKPSHNDTFLWLGILASLILVVLGWYLLAH